MFSLSCLKKFVELKTKVGVELLKNPLIFPQITEFHRRLNTSHCKTKVVFEFVIQITEFLRGLTILVLNIPVVRQLNGFCRLYIIKKKR